MNRRRYLQGTLAGGIAAFASPQKDGWVTPKRPPATGSQRGIQLAELFSPDEDHKIRLAAQVGITHAIVGVSGALARVPRDRYFETIEKIKTDFAHAGLVVAGVESHPVPAEKIKLGLAGRDQEIENYIAAIQALGKAGVRVLCYNWMAGLGWYRSCRRTRARRRAHQRVRLRGIEEAGPHRMGRGERRKDLE